MEPQGKPRVHVIGVPEVKKRDNEAEKKMFWRNNDWSFLKFNEKYKFIDLRSSVNPKQDKYKENHTWAHHSQTLEN